MRKYDYKFLKNETPGKIIRLSNVISELNIKESFQKQQYNDSFDKLKNNAIIESIKGSNAIEGIITTDDRIKEIVSGSKALTHDEKEIFGYKEALNIINKEYNSLEIDEKLILQLHKVMESVNLKEAGKYKKDNNYITEIYKDGSKKIRFKPVSANEVERNMQQLLLAYYEARQDEDIHPLLLMSCFIVDFLCIHPFTDGNGRVSRLLSVLIMYKNNYDIGKYISIEGKINEYKNEYYKALQQSSIGWHENKNDYSPFIIFMFQIIYMCYKELDEIFIETSLKKITKAKRVEFIITNSIVPISKAEISKKLKDISIKTIELELSKLVKQNKIKKIGTYKDARYIKND